MSKIALLIAVFFPGNGIIIVLLSKIKALKHLSARKRLIANDLAPGLDRCVMTVLFHNGKSG